MYRFNIDIFKMIALIMRVLLHKIPFPIAKEKSYSCCKISFFSFFVSIVEKWRITSIFFCINKERSHFYFSEQTDSLNVRILHSNEVIFKKENNRYNSVKDTTYKQTNKVLTDKQTFFESYYFLSKSNCGYCKERKKKNTLTVTFLS